MFKLNAFNIPISTRTFQFVLGFLGIIAFGACSSSIAPPYDAGPSLDVSDGLLANDGDVSRDSEAPVDAQLMDAFVHDGALPDALSDTMGADHGPTCTDGRRNQGEEDVDCGGPCPRCGCSLSSRSADLECQVRRYEKLRGREELCSTNFWTGAREIGTNYSLFSGAWESPNALTVTARDGFCFRYTLERGASNGRRTADPHDAYVTPVLNGMRETFSRVGGNESYTHNATRLPDPGTPVTVEMRFDEVTETITLPMPVEVLRVEADPFSASSDALTVHLTYPSTRPETPTTVLVTIERAIACVLDSSHDSVVIPRRLLGDLAAESRFTVRAEGYEFAARRQNGCRFQAILAGRNRGSRAATSVNVAVQP